MQRQILVYHVVVQIPYDECDNFICLNFTNKFNQIKNLKPKFGGSVFLWKNKRKVKGFQFEEKSFRLLSREKKEIIRKSLQLEHLAGWCTL